MKLFKIIMNCIVAVLLVVSITLNVLLLCGFEFTKTDDDTTATLSSDNSTTQTDSDTQSNGEDYSDPSVLITPETDNTDNTDGVLIYEDDNIKVTYIRPVEKPYGHVYECKIENKSSKTLNVLFTDVYINSKQVFISGLTCEHLLPETEALEEFVLSDKDGEAYTPSPSKVSFKIKLQNDKSKLDLYESDQITLKFN